LAHSIRTFFFSAALLNRPPPIKTPRPLMSRNVTGRDFTCLPPPFMSIKISLRFFPLFPPANEYNIVPPPRPFPIVIRGKISLLLPFFSSFSKRWLPHIRSFSPPPLLYKSEEIDPFSLLFPQTTPKKSFFSSLPLLAKIDCFLPQEE